MVLPLANRSPQLAARLLDAEIVFQSQGNINPTLRDALVIILVFVVVVVVVGDGFGDITGISIKLLDIPKGSVPTSIERLRGHGSNTIDACKLPQDLILFIFKEGFCAAFYD